MIPAPSLTAEELQRGLDLEEPALGTLSTLATTGTPEPICMTLTGSQTN